MHLISSCPVCGDSHFDPFLTCKDYTVSKTDFAVVRCTDCGFKFTNPVPDLSDLGNYYKSEDYVSHSSSKKGLINFLYNIVRKRTLRQKVKLVQRLSKGTKLLDVGCGTGHFLMAAKAAGFDVLGIEPDEDARRFANEKNNVKALNRDSFLTLSDQFDVISLWHVLEHLPDLNADIDRLSALLKPDGKLLIAVPNPESNDAKMYGANWAGYDVPRHLYHFSPVVIRDLFNRHGFSCLETLPMKYDAYYVAMLSEKNTGGSVVKGFLNGYRSNRLAHKNPDTWSSQIYIFTKK